jgi:quercetin dioxygenase-like cupin family protein
VTEVLLEGRGTTVRLVLSRESVTLFELGLDPGAGAGPHTHTREDETITVLDGELVVDEGTPHTYGPGEAVFLGRGTRHSLANEGESAVRALVVCTPGGLERFFREVSAAASDEEVAAAADRAGLVFG